MSESKNTPGGAWAEVDRQKREHAGHVQPVTTCTYCQDRFVWPKATPKPDPKDAAIAALKGEVERLADYVESPDHPRPERHIAIARGLARDARNVLRRLGLTEDGPRA